MSNINKNDIKESLRAYFLSVKVDYPEEVYDRYATFIESENRYFYRKFNEVKDRGNGYSHFDANFFGYSADDFAARYEMVYDFLQSEGYSEEQSIYGLRSLAVYYRKSLLKNLPVYEALGVKNDILIFHPDKLRMNIRELHARKLYLLNEGYPVEKNSLLNSNYSSFQKKYQAPMTKEQLMKQYPLTDEARKVCVYLRAKKEKEVEATFHLTKEQIRNCYPTTLDELKSIQRIGWYDKEALEERYGLTQEEILEKYPVNSNTLKSLRFIRCLSEEEVMTYFGKTKEEVLSQKHIDAIEIRRQYFKDNELEANPEVYEKRKVKLK